MITNTHSGSEWLDRTFFYWKPELMPTPREVMADLKANKTRNFAAILDKYGIKDPEKRLEAEWVIDSFLVESGDLHLHQQYGCLGFKAKVSTDGKIAVEIV